jgi:glyoxylase-like metal-dependent hydrolase (beta-lactamase superfamily II)
MSGTPAEVSEGIWRWTRRHPEWHSAEGFAAEVASYLVVDGADAWLVDPLLGDEAAPIWALLDGLPATAALRVLITIPYHVRDAELVRDRLEPARGPIPILGHRACRKRLQDDRGFAELTPDTGLPGGVRAFPIGSPRRFELPVWIPGRSALVFGDAVVAPAAGELRVWVQQPPSGVDLRWYRDRLIPTLAPLAALAPDNVLVTHGPPVLGGGAAALLAALDAGPWDRERG